MTTARWLLASLHLIALGIGLGAVFARGRTLHATAERPAADGKALRRVFLADGLWGLAAVLWIATGLARAFGGFEKGSVYYLHSSSFWIKMALLGVILALEAWPMTTLIRWRRRLRTKATLDLSSAGRMAQVSYVQALLVVFMVLAATAMARGLNP